MALSNKVILSGIWFQTSKFIQIGSGFFITAILARLLTPEDFGLIGVVTVCTIFVSLFTSVGFGAAIVQRQNINQRQLSSLYWMNFVMGLVTAVSVAATAHLAALFYGYPQLIPLIRIISLNFILSPLFQIHRKLMEKNLQFITLSKIQVVAVVGSGLIGIGLAFLGFGVYSLVWQSISLNIIYFLYIRLSNKWRPDYFYSWKMIKEMVFFSIKMKGAQLARYFERNIDFMILSKIFSTAVFGYYSLAFRVILFPIRTITRTFTEILFPVFSKIQDDIEKIKMGYLKSIQLIAIFLFPIMLIIAFYSKPLVFLVFGEKWIHVADVLLILSGVGVLQSIELISISIYPAINRPEVSLKLGIIRAIGIGTATYIGGLHGLIGAAIAILIANSLLFIISLIWLRKYVNFTYNEVLKYLSGPILGSIVILFTFFIFPIKNEYIWFELIKPVVLGVTFYTFSILLTNFKDIKYIFLRIRLKA